MPIYLMRPAKSLLTTGLMAFIDTLPNGCRMAEIGCYTGESTRLFLTKASQIVCVDPWEDYTENGLAMTEMDLVEILFSAVHAEAQDRIMKVKAPSVEAAATFPDGLFDLVYLDGNHEYLHVLADMAAWAPKVKSGGILAGHDYDHLGVTEGVRTVFGRPDQVFPDSTWMVRIHAGDEAA